MHKALLDTDILSEVVKGRSPVISAAVKAYISTFGHFGLSVVSVLEVVKGYRRRGRDQKIRDFLVLVATQEVFAVYTSTAVLAGQIQGDLERTGQTIGRSDPMIAATAIEHGLTLVTGNTAHFARIAALDYSLALDDWRTP